VDAAQRAAVDALLLHDVIHHQGTVYVTAQGLLGAAHLAGVRAIAVELLQAPAPANGHTAVCPATVVAPAGRFRGLGDASPHNSRETAPAALLPLAQVRAKARTLCDALNLAMVPAEDAVG
jgi:hypothetical protein